jgi:hypothetical protein
MVGTLAEPTGRALRIAQGLMRTGRASRVTTARGFICLRSSTSGFYWVAYDGKRVMRGYNVKTAENLQDGFISLMERAGMPAR